MEIPITIRCIRTDGSIFIAESNVPADGPIKEILSNVTESAKVIVVLNDGAELQFIRGEG